MFPTHKKRDTYTYSQGLAGCLGLSDGKELKQARLQARLSQRELARRAGLHHATVQYWETKPQVDPHSWGVQRILNALEWRIFRHQYAGARHGVLAHQAEMALVEKLMSEQKRRYQHRLNTRRVVCGAKTRNGLPCRAKSEPGRSRCRHHGGLSTGPKTREGRKRISEAQKSRWREARRNH